MNTFTVRAVWYPLWAFVCLAMVAIAGGSFRFKSKTPRERSKSQQWMFQQWEMPVVSSGTRIENGSSMIPRRRSRLFSGFMSHYRTGSPLVSDPLAQSLHPSDAVHTVEEGCSAGRKRSIGVRPQTDPMRKIRFALAPVEELNERSTKDAKTDVRRAVGDSNPYLNWYSNGRVSAAGKWHVSSAV